MKCEYRAFSLVELLVVITIVAVLSAAAVPVYRNYMIKSRVQEVMSVMHYNATLINQYISIHSNVPPAGVFSPVGTLGYGYMQWQ